MDPWCTNKTADSDSDSKTVNCISKKSFEDNFNPTVSDTLPDSKFYLETLEKKLLKTRADAGILQQLAEKREACMQQLLSGVSNYDHDDSLDTPLNSSSLLRAVAPERQALTTGEIVEFIKYDRLDPENDNDNSPN